MYCVVVTCVSGGQYKFGSPNKADHVSLVVDAMVL